MLPITTLFSGLAVGFLETAVLDSAATPRPVVSVLQPSFPGLITVFRAYSPIPNPLLPSGGEAEAPAYMHAWGPGPGPGLEMAEGRFAVSTYREHEEYGTPYYRERGTSTYTRST
ncbi:hypothetical protein F4802DRAFT_544027 [Xylaria palmicola]|nr:hypothetical protein F4802DRAFT_544027 [Xylaria palmicola]